MKAVVVGGGVIGAAVAYRLAEAGVHVVLLEAGRPAEGTSRVSFAWVSAAEKFENANQYRLGLACVEAHRELAKHLGAEVRAYRRPGVVQWRRAGREDGASSELSFERKLSRLRELDYPAERLDAADLRRIEPSLGPAALDDAEWAIHYPQDGYLDATVFVGALLDSAVRLHGAEIRTRMPVREIAMRAGRAVGVVTAAGERIEAHVVVNCAGRWINDCVGHEAPRLPMRSTLGLIAYTPPVIAGPRKILRTPDLNVRPDGGGRLLLRADDLDGTLGHEDVPSASHPAARLLVERLGRLVPELRGLEAEAARIAVRPIPKGGLPCVGPVPGLENYWVAVTHGGINASAFIGKALRDEIVSGRPAPEYAPFRPARFFEAA